MWKRYSAVQWEDVDKLRVKVLTNVEWWNEDSILKKGKTDLITVYYVTITRGTEFIRIWLSLLKPRNLLFYSFIQVVCLTTGPKPLPKRALHIVRSRASSFKSEYPLFSLRLSSNFLRLLPHLPITSIPLLSFLQ